MSDLKTFQDEHGEPWNAITQHPAFGAAMSHLNLAKLEEIASLTNEDIAANAPIILAGLRDHLRHENDLIRLGTKPDLVFRGVGPEDYRDPLEEIETPDGPPPESPKPAAPKKTTRKRK